MNGIYHHSQLYELLENFAISLRLNVEIKDYYQMELEKTEMLISKEFISNILSQSENYSTFDLRLRYAFSIFSKEFQDKLFWGYIVILVFFLSVVILITKYAPNEQNNWFREERIDKNYKLVRDIAGIISIGLIVFGFFIYIMW